MNDINMLADDEIDHRIIENASAILQYWCHKAACDNGWWTDIHTGEDMIGKRNAGELLCLIHSEISEAMEGHRTSKMDDKLPNRSSLEVELADAVIRIFDFGGGFNLDIAGALVEKLDYNASRMDHKMEERKKPTGKKI